MYLFTPFHLRLARDKHTPLSFFSKLITYTRFTTPGLPLNKIIDHQCTLSPFNRIETWMKEAKLAEELNSNAIIYELRMLVNMFRGELRGFTNLIRVNAKTAATREHCSSRIDQLLQELDSFQTRIQDLYSVFLNPHTTEKVIKALSWVDESVNIITERQLLIILKICLHCETLGENSRKLKEYINSLYDYRRHCRYTSFYNSEDPDWLETITYREGILKKWSQSAMYLTVEKAAVQHNLGQILAGTAAGMAMAFAVAAAFLAEKFFLRNSVVWALLIIVSYIFKDRIKEILREVFGKLLPRLLADRIRNLIDPATGNKIGRISNTVYSRKEISIPENVRNLRICKPNPFREILPQEDILQYERVITLRGKLLKQNHSRLEGVTDVVRLRIDDWLKEMDDPVRTFEQLEKNQIKKQKGKKNYYIHVIVSLNETNKSFREKLFLYRLVVNKKGIVRVEFLEER